MDALAKKPQRFKVDWGRIIDNDDDHDAAEYFFKECVWTRDEAASGRKGDPRTIKRYPWENRPDLRKIVHTLIDAYGVVDLMGSPRTLKTYTLVDLHSFWALRERDRAFFFGSTKQERADLNISRVVFTLSMLKSLDLNKIQPPALNFVARTETAFHLGNGSFFEDLTQSVADLTQVTASGVWLDEYSKIKSDDDKRDMYSYGTTRTQTDPNDPSPGGLLVCSGTCNGEERQWNRMFPDEEAEKMLISPYDDVDNTEGLRCPENGLRIWGEPGKLNILLYYFADPGKCPGTPWYKAEKRKWAANEDGWRREMEIYPIVTGESSITPEWRDGTHLHKFEELKKLYDESVSLVVGWDIGARYQAATVTQRNKRTGQIIVFMSIFQDNSNLGEFVRNVVGQIKAEFPRAEAYHLGDPKTLSTTIPTASDAFETLDYQRLMEREGVYCRQATCVPIGIKLSKLKEALSTYSRGVPMLAVAKERSKPLVSAMRGDYQYDASGERHKRGGKSPHVIDSLVFTLLQHMNLEDVEGDYLGGNEEDNENRALAAVYADYDHVDNTPGL